MRTRDISGFAWAMRLARGLALIGAIGGMANMVMGQGRLVSPLAGRTPPTPSNPALPLNLVDATAQTGIDFIHSTGAAGRRYIVETVVAGLAVFDYDNDGWLDIYFLNGAPLPGTSPSTNLLPGLYRNNGDCTFANVTEQSGLAVQSYGMGVTAGDYDEDGDDDLYVANFGQNILYANGGDGTFTIATSALGRLRPAGFGTSGVWLDIDRDGDLDLYSGNYVDFQFQAHQPRLIGGHEFHPGPAAYRPLSHEMYRNNGDGTFADISTSSGIASTPGPGMGAIALDADQDGDMDLFVCNDGQPNFLFVNDGRGKFTEQAFLSGVAVDRGGSANGNMGVDAADFDGDGLLDLITTDYQDELPVLYRNQGSGQFEDATTRARIDVALLPHVKWGVGLPDIDNDGDRDIFIACGHFLDNIRFVDDRTDLKVPNFLLINDGRGRFQNASKQAGSGLQVVASSRGAAVDDLDNDGDSDIVVLNADGPPTLIRNDSPPAGHWLDVRLIGRVSNRSAAGGLVRLTAEGRSQVLAVHNGRGYQSHYGTRLHFGLGTAVAADRIEIHWPSGQQQTLSGDQLAIDRTIDILEPLPAAGQTETSNH